MLLLLHAHQWNRLETTHAMQCKRASSNPCHHQRTRQDDPEDYDTEEEDKRRPWYRRRKVLLYASSFLVAAALLVVGICTQWGVKPMVSALGSGKVELFRWMYFFSLWPPLWVVTRVANNRLFVYIEKIFFMWVL